MKSFLHDKYWPREDQVRFFNNWDQFNDDPRTKDVDLHIGGAVDYSKFRSEKINIHINGEWPNEFFGGKNSGSAAHRCVEIENKFDYVLNFDKPTAKARGHIYAPYGYNYNNIISNLSWDNIDDIEKDNDIFMIGHCKMNPMWHGEHDAIYHWYQTISKFNHIFCNNYIKNAPGKKWSESMDLSARSKISIVWVDFLYATSNNRSFAESNYNWITFKDAIIKVEDGKTISKPTVPQMKGRVYNAAFSKSIILCYKGPWANEKAPYNSPIEDYLDPGVDFIYFEDCNDLERKIKEILKDYNNPKYKEMVDSAHAKMKNNHDVTNIYEKYIIPLSEKGKTK
tara:strand:+ start:1778 stop:2794 length:1017 start_codon:yes stop_codon:yes gene_type:complete